MSASFPTDRVPNSGRWISCAGLTVDRRTISCRGTPIARNLDITLVMLRTVKFPVCRSVDIESGINPCLTAGTALRNQKLPAPWPTSKLTLLARASARMGLILPDGKINPILAEARARGVIFDVGHGAGSFWFRNAVPAVKQGFIPDSMSTDLHSGNFTVLSINNVMSKFLAMGVSLDDVIRRSTVNPASEIHRPELGTLSVGKDADIAILELMHGHFAYVDCGVAKMDANLRLIARMTLRAGRILFDPSGLSMVEWEKARPQYFNTPALGSSTPARTDDYPRE